MEGTQTPDLYALLHKVSTSPMLQFDPAEYFERATLVFMQFSCMNRKINDNNDLLHNCLKQLQECNHMLRKVAKKL